MNEITQDLWLLLTDPNVSYLLLVLGLWATVLAVSLPGTGLPEATAAVSLALAAVGLLQLPFSLAGTGLILLALALFIAEFPAHAHGAMLLSGAVALIVGASLIYGVDQDRSTAHLSWVSLIGAPLVTSLVFGLFIRQALKAMHVPAMQDPRRLIGAQGYTRTETQREGTVYVGGELWSATAEQQIPPDTKVVVLERTGLVLKVAPAAAAPAKV
jgi:membrane-bound serine protease (ClpP class)